MPNHPVPSDLIARHGICREEWDGLVRVLQPSSAADRSLDEVLATGEQAMAPARLSEAEPWTVESAKLHDLDASGVTTTLLALLRELGHVESASAERAGAGQSGDAAIVRAQLGATTRSLAVAASSNERFAQLSPEGAARTAVSEALRRLYCSGATPLLLASAVQTSGAAPERVFQLREYARGLSEVARFFEIPVATSVVAAANTAERDPSQFVPTVKALGLLAGDGAQVERAFRATGEKLVLLGGAPNELGGSFFLAHVHGLVAGVLPTVEFSLEKKLQRSVQTLIKAGVALAAHSVSTGGLLVSIANMLAASPTGVGVKLDLNAFGATRSDALLFGESQGRVIIAAAGERVGTVLSEAHTSGVSATVIGETIAADELQLFTRRLSAKWTRTELMRVGEL